MTENKEIEQESEVSSDKYETPTEINDTVKVESLSAAEVLQAEIDQLRNEMAALQLKAEENHELALRAKAESENTRRRVEKDIANAHKFALEKFSADLLPVLDSMELGLAATQEENANIERIREGSELTFKMLSSAVEKHGIKVVNPQGEKFNPDFHQAMSLQENTELEPNTVMAVLQKGYTLQGRLVRPAMVIVSKGEENKPEAGQIDEIV